MIFYLVCKCMYDIYLKLINLYFSIDLILKVYIYIIYKYVCMYDILLKKMLNRL